MIYYLLFYLFYVYVRIFAFTYFNDYFTYFMLEYFKFILLFIFLMVFFFVCQFRLMHKMTGVSHGKKLRLSNLTVSLHGEENNWFWGPVNDSGLSHLLKTVYNNISHMLVCALSKR